MKINFENASYADLSLRGTLTLMTRTALDELLDRDPAAASQAGDFSSVLVVCLSDVMATWDLLVAMGATLVAPPRPSQGGGPTVAYLTDPDGHLIELNDSKHVG